MSTASNIAMALSACVARITVANGFLTDIGLRVYRGKRSLDKDDVPCVILIEGEDSVSDKTRVKAKIGQQYLFEGYDECDPNNPNDRAHDIIADLKRALFADTTLGGLVKQIDYAGRLIGPREDGSPLVFGRVAITAEFVEDLQNP